MKILNVLSSNKYSGAENVVCQIANLICDKNEIYYCSPFGPIEDSLKEKDVAFVGVIKLNISQLKKVIKKIKPDLIIAHDIKASFYVSLTHVKVPYICQLHNNASENHRISLKSCLFNYACKRAKKVIFVSESCYNDYYYKNKLKDKAVILKNVISLKQIEKKSSQDKREYNNDIIFLGRLSEPKNPLFLLEILLLAIQKNKNIKCAIVGDGELRVDCEKFVRENNLEDNIKFYGFVSNPYKILKDSKLMLMSSRYEGTPMCALESLALGVPIVSTPTDGLMELIKTGKTGYIYQTKEEAVEYIFKIINNYEKYKKDCLKYSEKVNDLKAYKEKLINIIAN